MVPLKKSVEGSETFSGKLSILGSAVRLSDGTAGGVVVSMEVRT